MAQWVNTPATRPSNLSAIPGPTAHMVERPILPSCPLASIHALWQTVHKVYMHMYTRAQVEHTHM